MATTTADPTARLTRTGAPHMRSVKRDRQKANAAAVHDARQAARRRILNRTQAHVDASRVGGLRAKHLQISVCACRRKGGIVSDEVLVTAGFNPPRRATAPPVLDAEPGRCVANTRLGTRCKRKVATGLRTCRIHGGQA